LLDVNDQSEKLGTPYVTIDTGRYLFSRKSGRDENVRDLSLCCEFFNILYNFECQEKNDYDSQISFFYKNK